MKVSNKITIELSFDEAKELAKIINRQMEDPWDTESFDFKLRESICSELNIKSWDL
jgi:hypothetical protein